MFNHDELSTNVSEADGRTISKYVGISTMLLFLFFLCPFIAPIGILILISTAAYLSNSKEEVEREKLCQQKLKREHDSDIARQRRKPVRAENSSPTKLMKRKTRR